MVKRTPKPDALLAWMDGLADETRLRLVRLLERHELSVAELCEIIQLPQSTVSRHLKVLSEQEWVRSRSQGTTNLYRTVLDELDPTPRKLWLIAREQTEGWATTAQDELRLNQTLRKRQSDPQAFFAGAAGQWDKLRGELYGRNFSAAALLALLPKDLTVADLGCGTGPLIADLAPHVAKIIGIDNSSDMLKAAKKRLADAPNVDLRRGDLANLPIDDACCDAALLVLALTYVPEPKSAIAEAARVLKPGGKLVVVDLLPHDRDDFRRQMGQLSLGLSPEFVAGAMNDAKLHETNIRPLPPEASAKGPALFLATGLKPN
ncbi:metalloregulator ArsR/SmtB family transcription factor [Humisphaera borealis]|uniref:Metalloregulator ArsR/SmtB family transcription factor n=1 Tax=Humisphaera borealis TaxID=2807512 RepID=A0A7M2WQM1_9BACT|nr:metalloregulator ArsR/SmtB family transcription factor [Humisphaera borealis]QOV87845.1 metalloregulator ArsR/SmtB family transcription factor [Humisphaera borealis]